MLDFRGQQLYYANAYFNGCANGLPCVSQLAIGQNVNDSTYNVSPTSAAQLAKVDDTGYLVYAENITEDNLELYYTRIKKNTLQTELCVAVRNAVTDTFSLPSVIYSNPSYIIEAPTLTTDKSRLYYHKKMSSNFKIYLRYRTNLSGINELSNSDQIHIYPNPAKTEIHIEMPTPNEEFSADIYDMFGRNVMSFQRKIIVNTGGLAPVVYSLVIRQKGNMFIKKLVIL